MQESGSEDSKISRNYKNALEQMDQQDGWQVEQEARIILTKLGFPEMDQKWLCYLVVKSVVSR